MPNKVCRVCEREKPVEEFYQSKGRVESQCKVCRLSKQTSLHEKRFANNESVDLNGTKTCTSCLLEKPKTEFGIQRRVQGGLNSKCKKCSEGNYKAYYRSLEGQITYRLLAAKDRAVKSGLEFSVTQRTILDMWDNQKGLCAITGHPIDVTATGTHTHRGPMSLSIDRIDNRAGYTDSNVRLTTLAANQARNMWSDDDLVEMMLGWLTFRGYQVSKKEGK